MMKLFIWVMSSTTALTLLTIAAEAGRSGS